MHQHNIVVPMVPANVICTMITCFLHAHDSMKDLSMYDIEQNNSTVFTSIIQMGKRKNSNQEDFIFYVNDAQSVEVVSSKNENC